MRNKKLLLAHRVIYERERGQIESNRDLHHLCRVRPCVNPDHLVVASRRRHGEIDAQDRSALDWPDVCKIRALRHDLTQHQLARAFETTQTTISKVLLNKTWHDPKYQP